MRRPVFAMVGLVAVWFGVWLVPGAEAEAPEATGWWSRTRFTPTPLGIPQPGDFSTLRPVPTVVTIPGTAPSTPSPVPPGGLYVAGESKRLEGSQVPLELLPNQVPVQEVPDVDPDPVPVGISALRLYVGEDAAVGNLVLEFDKVRTPQGTELPVDNKQGTVEIQACIPAYYWTPDEGGNIDSAPKPDCAQGLAYGEEIGSTVKIPVGGLVRDGLLDLVLMPQPNAAFHAVFKKPGANAVELAHYPRSDDGGGDDDLPFIPDVNCDCPLGEVPVLAGTGPLDSPLVLPGPGPYEVRPPVAGRSRVVDGGSRLIADSVPELAGWQKAVAGGVLAALVGLYVVLLRAPAGVPLPIGPWAARRRTEDGTTTPRGIGRFARPRAGPHPRL